MTQVLTDGHATTLTFSLASSVSFAPKEVTPPGVDGGDEIDTTTMLNNTWRTRAPRSLITLTECEFSAAYDPEVYDTILSMVNINQQITVHFSDGSTLMFWGWVKRFKPNGSKEGDQPMADVVITPSNQNSSGVETAPDYTA